MTLLPALLGGAGGAVALTTLHQTARHRVSGAPRMDVMMTRALKLAVGAARAPSPSDRTLYRTAFVGDLVANTLYYGLIGLGRSPSPWRRAFTLGLGAGVVSAIAPRAVGLGPQPGERHPRTPLLTVAWYLTGALVTGTIVRALTRPA